jgi:hypothetical protein
MSELFSFFERILCRSYIKRSVNYEALYVVFNAYAVEWNILLTQFLIMNIYRGEAKFVNV